jgi:2-iminoacetate synthase
MELEIRDYKLEDIEDVYSILTENFTHPWDKKSLSITSNNFIKKVLILNGKIIGFLEMQIVANEADLVMIAIKKDLQRKGLGGYFLREIIKYLKERGIKKIFLEVYDKDIYKQVHTSGEKTDYDYRLEAPERGAKAGIRSINIGVLFGLADIIKEAFFSGLNAKYLMDKYINSEISLSLPRINHAEGGYKPKYNLSNKQFLQIMLAYRLYIPSIGINISTREKADFRDHLIGLGVTKFSAGSKTDVGGYEGVDTSTPQFDISDNRSVKEIVKVIKEKGYQPVFKDWETI